MEEDEELPEPWILFTDGSSCMDGSGAGLILTNPKRIEFTYALRFRFDATNKEVKYEALIVRLRITKQMGVRTLTGSFKAFSIKQIPRSENKKANALSKIASTSFAHLSKQVLVEELKEKSINEVEILAVIEEEGDTWMNPLFKYLPEGTLPVEVQKAKAIRRPLQANYVLREIHEGSCSMHAGTRSVVARALRTGYYWPIMHRDARTLIRACQDCQTNGLVERANRSLGEGIKARLEAKSKNWMEELPHVLWAHRKMIKSSNEDTLFALTYGTEAVIPTEIRMPTIRIAEADQAKNNEALQINLDLLEERREEAAIREAKSKAKIEKYYNAKVQNTSFKLGDLVYRNNDASRAEDIGKLGPKWEGPYEVTEALGKGAYKLRDRDGKHLPRTWNISNLKKCYVHKI
ncbi:reverse transcriptase domain-containing protein [Tanacetum coccineum]|uniref:Reverse transcriptase domain-containing protein n=1 Tax=Tanacetum coccineum TaxID=301880 RepID=A0ABQ5B148_9ASTR